MKWLRCLFGHKWLYCSERPIYHVWHRECERCGKHQTAKTETVEVIKRWRNGYISS